MNIGAAEQFLMRGEVEDVVSLDDKGLFKLFAFGGHNTFDVATVLLADIQKLVQTAELRLSKLRERYDMCIYLIVPLRGEF